MRKTKQTSLPNKKKNRVATNARKVTTMTINFNRGTIELTSTEMKSAMIYVANLFTTTGSCTSSKDSEYVR